MGEPLTDDSPMPFGKYSQHRMEDVPASYLIWFKENVAPTYANQGVHDYIDDNMNVLMKELKK